MTPEKHISSYCSIKNNTVTLNGTVIYSQPDMAFLDFIKSAYKTFDTKYSKFFKMDNLSKLAFLTADVLLNERQLGDDNNIAVVLSNKASSLDTDRTHQNAIQDKNSYYPSPAVFVYTLPNICIGEISIKYKLFSENSFFIFESFNASHLLDYSNSLFSTNKADEVLCGWVDFDDNNYEAFLYLVSDKGPIKHEIQNITTLYNS